MNTMKWYDWMQYGALLLLTAVMTFTWRYAMWAASLLVLVTLVKMVAQRKVGNSTLTPPLRWILYAPIIYWAVLALSLLWTSDMAAGWDVLRLKAMLLIFPLCFLLSDTSYLSRKHLRGIGYTFLISLCIAFAYLIIKAAVSETDSFTAFTNAYFDGQRDYGVYHHAYIALYAVAAIIFVYHELVAHWKELRVWNRILLIASVVVMFGYVVVVNSRAGMLAMALVFLCCLLHQMFCLRRWWQAPLVALMLAAAGMGVIKLVPGYQDRISSTLQKVQEEGKDGDARLSINHASLHAYLKSPLVGYGVGDYRAKQVEQYDDEGYDYGVKAKFNAHNQYMESLLAAGIPGLLALFFVLLSPIWALWRRRSQYWFPLSLLIAVVMLNFLFESMLERQMGVLFIGLVIPLMALIMSMEENKFARMAKS